MSTLRMSGNRWWGLTGAVVASAVVGGALWSSTAPVPVRAQTPEAKSVAGAGEHARALSRAFRSAAESVLPTVVTIETRSNPRARAQVRPGPGRSDNPFRGTPFEEFFRDELGQGPRLQPDARPQREGTGSGVIIDAEGIVLTNNHVVAGADMVTVRLNDGREFEATEFKTDPQTDLAIVRLKNAKGLPAAKLGNSDEMEIGDWVIAVGAPFGLDHTVSAGIISGKGRELSAGQRTRFLQTDAAINPGNSGGPLVNLDGEVIGINTAIASNSGGYQGIGFAIPANLAKWVTQQLTTSGLVRRAYLGVGIGQVSTELANKFGIQKNQGVLVAEVFPDSPAAVAGFHEGDIITAFAGTSVKSPRDLQEVVEQAALDSKQKVEVLRDGQPRTLEVVVKALPDNLGRTVQSSTPDDAAPMATYLHRDTGLEVVDLGAKEAEQLGFKNYKGVLISGVEEDSPAASLGLRPGMLIMKVGKLSIESVEQFKQAMSGQSVKDGILLLVRTEAGNRFVVLEKK